MVAGGAGGGAGVNPRDGEAVAERQAEPGPGGCASGAKVGVGPGVLYEDAADELVRAAI